MKLSLLCEVLTPLFMHGDNYVEIRSSAIKGMMRFWWRAIKSENDINKLKKEEAKIFGGTGKGEGRSKIKVNIDYAYDKFQEYIGLNFKEKQEDKQREILGEIDSGIGYLLYSTIIPGREKLAIKDGFTFNITLESFDEKAFKNAVASLWAAMYLGGFGMRSRRGAGSLKIVKAEFLDYNDKDISTFPDFIMDDFKNLPADFIKINFEKTVKLINNEGYIKDFCYPYSNLSFSRFIISGPFDKWQDALSDIGKSYLEFRKKHESDLFGTGVFGLPIIHHKGRLTCSISIRRASPIIIKILENRGKFYWVVLRLAGEFLPEGCVLRFNFSNDRFETQKPNYGLIDKFWNELKNKGEEHILSIPKTLKNILDRIVDILKPSQIFLFGSKARGDFHKRSDTDIAVKTDIPLTNLDINSNCDIVNFAKINNGFKSKIEEEGIKLYERKIN